MLTVYLFNAPKPSPCFDLSYEPVSALVDSAVGIFAHHKTATLWLGYLEGWMLTSEEETRMRMVIRTFDCHLTTREPFSFSQAWKNEIECIHVKDSSTASTVSNGHTDTHHDGGSVHGERPIEHQSSSRVPTINGLDHQD
jgi:hypothetical protein